ncbi:MAG: Amuc_1100 family pilus-like protein, partial [Kiritimatiellae bacterium]|nr:Amuc_1100 family pilus-like protein [Kiritimatiellia bacterium]
MDKAKVAFIAVAVVALLGAIGLGVVAYTKFGAAAEARGERDDANRKLDNLYRSEVFPNQENVAAMDDVLAEFNDSRDAFTNNLDKAN